MTSMPASRISSTSCQRFSLREPGHVGVGQLVDQGHLGAPGQHGVDVHLLEALAPVLEGPAGEDLEVTDLGGGVGPAVGLDDGDHDVGAALVAAPALVEHGEGLAHAGAAPR